jgi:hypothetical protein
MKLKEKFELPIDAHNKINSYVTKQLEVIAVEYAIRFLEFVRFTCEEDWEVCDNYLYEEKSYTIRELLEIFKKEKGL